MYRWFVCRRDAMLSAANYCMTETAQLSVALLCFVLVADPVGCSLQQTSALSTVSQYALTTVAYIHDTCTYVARSAFLLKGCIFYVEFEMSMSIALSLLIRLSPCLVNV